MMRRATLILLLFLPLVGALGGYALGPFLARASFEVQLAERIHKEDAQGLAERTLESEAFRAAGEPKSVLFAKAERTEKRLRFGGAFLGAWIGLVVGLKLASQSRAPKQDIYEIDGSVCVCCGRCFMVCPRERLRLQKLGRLQK